MAQERTVPQHTQGEVDTAALGPSAVPSLLQRLEEVRAEPLSAQRELACGRLNAALLAVPQLEDREAAAAWMLQQLDAEAFHGLVDEKGTSARACAVESVLAVGYPVALQLEPEDIEYYREAAKSSRRTGSEGLTRALVAAGVAHASALALFVSQSSSSDSSELVFLGLRIPSLAAAAGLASAVLMARLPTEGRAQWALRAVAAAASAALLITFSPSWVIEPGGPLKVLATLLSASAGLLAALAPRRSDPAGAARPR